jgi:hypothetical protein
MSGMQIAGLAVAGVGAVGVIVGSVFGLMAIGANDESLEPQNCRTETFCTEEGIELREDAESHATVSSVGFVAGGLLLAGGLVIYLVAPSGGADRATLRLAPRVGAYEQGLSLQGSF